MAKKASKKDAQPPVKLTPKGDHFLYYVGESSSTERGPPAASEDEALEMPLSEGESVVRILGVYKEYPGGMDVDVVWEDDSVWEDEDEDEDEEIENGEEGK